MEIFLGEIKAMLISQISKNINKNISFTPKSPEGNLVYTRFQVCLAPAKVPFKGLGVNKINLQLNTQTYDSIRCLSTLAN